MKRLRRIKDNEQHEKSIEQDVDNDYPVIQSKLEKDNKKIKKTKSNKIPSKSNSNLQEGIQLNSHQQILDIRHSDESTREHIRHSFLKRWDGISNQFQLTESQLKELSPIHQVYWRVKSKNMNVIIFQQLGRRQYMAFQNDAIKLSEMFKKQIRTVNKSLAVTFWFKEIEVAKGQLFLRKIPVMIMNEIDDPEYRQLHGFVRRQVVQVQTPGLHLDMQDSQFKERLTLAILKNKNRFGFVVLDSENNHFYVGQLQDDEYFHEIRRVINRYRPVEVIIPDKNHKQIGQIAKTICNPYVVEVKIKIESVLTELLKFKNSNSSYFFQELIKRFTDQNIKDDNEFSKYSSVCVLSLMWQYLSSLSLLEKIFCQGLFHSQGKELGTQPFFDSQVYQNLEIFRIKNQEQGYAKPGTLIAYLNKCMTLQGKKQLHKWIDQPLQNLNQIKRRQYAIRELVEDKPQVLILHQKLTAYERFDKRITDIYHWVLRNSEQGKLNLTKLINYQKQYDQKKNPVITRLKQIIQILRLFQKYEQFLKELRKFNIKSEYLLNYIQLLSIDNIHVMSLEQISKMEGIPQIGYVADIILRKFNYDEVTEYLQPAAGIYEVFDSQKQKIEEFHRQLQKQLMKWKEYFNSDRVIYISVRARNQIEVPKSLIKNKKHQDLIFSSEVGNAMRYSTAKTYELNMQLIQHETVLSQTYQPFLQEVVKQFCSYRYLWDLYMQSMANVDVLMSLAKVARNMVPRCLPQFNGDRLIIKNGCNVSLLQVMKNVIPNTLNMTERERILLLTGPNMGGKSTLLKQTCLLAIMAQIGCYVPAQEYHSIVFDQIFCRIGASDRIYQGKSTFYVELQQTKRIIDKATNSSLVIIDQLGRGTSTYDGMAIAESVIDYILNKIGCFTLFSTHYSQITERFENRAEVKLMKMSSELQGQDLVFTYQLVNGIAQKSFASNVGRMVGLPKQILNLANNKSEQMHHETKKKQILRQACFLSGLYSSKPINKEINNKTVIGAFIKAKE